MAERIKQALACVLLLKTSLTRERGAWARPHYMQSARHCFQKQITSLTYWHFGGTSDLETCCRASTFKDKNGWSVDILLREENGRPLKRLLAMRMNRSDPPKHHCVKFWFSAEMVLLYTMFSGWNFLTNLNVRLFLLRELPNSWISNLINSSNHHSCTF